MRYDIAVIGNDEAAFEMLSLAAESGKRTAAVLPESSHSAWLVGIALRRLVSDLLVDRSSSRRRLLARTGSPGLLRRLVQGAIARETDDLHSMLQRLNVHIRMGQPEFVDRHSLSIVDGRTGDRSTLHAQNFVIGTGTRLTAMYRPPGLTAMKCPETLFEGSVLPKSICLLGGDSFGCGMAALFSLFGVRSRHIARDSQDPVMLDLARAAGVEIAFHPSELAPTQSRGVLTNAHADVVDCRRAIGFTDRLNLPALDVEADENGQLWCSSGLETWCPGVFGIGDVVGFSADSTLHPSVQAEQIMRRIRRQLPGPHYTELFASNQHRGNARHQSMHDALHS